MDTQNKGSFYGMMSNPTTKGWSMYTVRAEDVRLVLETLPTSAHDVELRHFDPDSRCSVSIEPTKHGQALLLIADSGQYRALVAPSHAPKVLRSLKESGSYQREDTGGRARWAIARAQAATAAA